MEKKIKKSITSIPNRILIIPDSNSVTSSGILTVTKERPTTGTVLSIGKHKGDYDIFRELKPGVRVLFGEWAGIEYVYEKTKFYSMRIKDVFAIIN